MVDKQTILDSVGPVQAVLDAHDGIVNVMDTTDGVIMISLEGGCTGCSATPMTAMQIYYSLMKLEDVKGTSSSPMGNCRHTCAPSSMTSSMASD
ncbi:MAG: hypothetical protein CM1200mP32_08400 [Methanobacteriota archaeon]|nr:MAG: hypothetical protein CM1200mP32_08400 [Euryarchaeota archaeon]